jgi:enamine deaminase RidA (YjgF/YER057c/UK114 family)
MNGKPMNDPEISDLTEAEQALISERAYNPGDATLDQIGSQIDDVTIIESVLDGITDPMVVVRLVDGRIFQYCPLDATAATHRVLRQHFDFDMHQMFAMHVHAVEVSRRNAAELGVDQHFFDVEMVEEIVAVAAFVAGETVQPDELGIRQRDIASVTVEQVPAAPNV